jgi:D-amino-acid oxidase
VHACDGVMAVKKPQARPPEAADQPHQPCDPGTLPPGYAAGWRVTGAPLVAMPPYLAYLEDRFRRAGGMLLPLRTFRTLAEVAESSPAAVIVNCTGAGARELVPDPSVTPVRGQVTVVANPGISEFFVDESPDPGQITYLFPHGETVVLGGTEEPGNASRVPDRATAERILAAVTAVEPRLAGAAVLGHRVGLRPWRPQVRLEAEVTDGGRHLVHNYGHGGAGVSLAWGCAADTARLVQAALA